MTKVEELQAIQENVRTERVKDGDGYRIQVWIDPELAQTTLGQEVMVVLEEKSRQVEKFHEGLEMIERGSAADA